MAEYGWKPHRISLAKKQAKKQLSQPSIYWYVRRENQRVRFHRIRDSKQYYFNSIPPTSHSWRDRALAPAPSAGRLSLGGTTCLTRYFSNTASFVSCEFRRVKDHHSLLHDSSLLKNTCVRRVVLGKWFPLLSARRSSPGSVMQLATVGVSVLASWAAAVTQKCTSKGI